MLSACLVNSISEKYFSNPTTSLCFHSHNQGLYNYHWLLELMHYSSKYSALKSLVTFRMRSFLTFIFRCRSPYHEPFLISLPYFIYFSEIIYTRDHILYYYSFIAYIPNGIWVHWGQFQCPEQLLTDNNGWNTIYWIYIYINERCYTLNCNCSLRLRYYTQTKLPHVNRSPQMEFGSSDQSF